jgi:sRNA-binding regulator protein Hfq
LSGSSLRKPCGGVVESVVPSEVFAEDIEALLERLDGVTSARVVANDAGEIASIYVTAATTREEPVVRRMIASALMSRYSLAIDGWRIRVARMQTETPVRTWRPRRVDESLSGTAVQALVELEPVDTEDGGTLVGRARSLPDRTNRLRGLALATLDAMKSVLDAEERRGALESIALQPLAGRDTLVVAVSIGSPTGSQLCVGSAVVEGSEADAVIAATLDAVSKRGVKPQRRGWGMKDRRDELESMRAHYRRLREPQRQMPELAPEDDGVDNGADDAGADQGEIRPERPGGAAMASIAPPDAGVRADQPPSRPAQRSSMEDDFLRSLVSTSTPVHIRCRDGYEIPEAVINDVGTYSVLVKSDNGAELVFKHGILSIRPLRAANHLRS